MDTGVEERVKQAARKWQTLASEGEIQATDIFFRFIAIYIAFIAILINKYSFRGRGRNVKDWERLKWFAEEAIELHRQLLAEPRYSAAVEKLIEKPIFNLQRNNREEIVKEKSDLSGVLNNCVRPIRNNLFHGGKDPGNARDKVLIESSYIIVSELIKPYLE